MHFNFLDSQFIRKNIKALTSTKTYLVLEVQNTPTPKPGVSKVVFSVS